MKKNIQYVAQEKFVALSERLGATMNAQKGWLKFTGPVEGKAVYVANTKQVGAVDISGFSLQAEGIIEHQSPPTKRVLQQIDFTQPEPITLKAFALALKALLDPAIPAIAKVASEPVSKEELERTVDSVLSACDE